MSALDRVTNTIGLVATMRRARLIAPLRPDKYVRIAAVMRRENMAATSGFASAAQRCPHRPGLVDELGTLTWKQIDERSDALGAALQNLRKPGLKSNRTAAQPNRTAALKSDRTAAQSDRTAAQSDRTAAQSHRTAALKFDVAASAVPRVIGIMCRNHRGFVEALIAANRIGSDVLLLNTSFAGPALAEVVAREGADAMIYDEEFTDTVERALADRPEAMRIVAWSDKPSAHEVTVEKLIQAHAGEQPRRATQKCRTVLLTSGTTGTPKGAKLTGGDAFALKSILDRTPWRAEEIVVIVAPMFHAWGFSQLIFAASMACTVVTRRKFDPEATLELVDRHRATGLAVVPVMFDRIMDLPADVRNRYSGRSLRFAAASGSRMRPDVVIAFMDQFGDVIVNNYNATEAGLIASATPEDLRAAPDTAGRPAPGTQIRILDKDFREVPTGEVGQIYVRSGTLFDGYTSGATNDFHEGFMASGDLGYLDSNGRLFVVGRDDEMIVSGGENVYPIEVEKILAAHPEVAEASVLGVDDEQYGQRLAAFVVLAPGASATADTLKQHVRDNLANYKVPREIIVLEELPRSSTGKILRNDLKARVSG